MIDISFFMSQLQQRVTKAHNRHKDWDGILWNERFKSAIIGGDRNRSATIAAEEHQPQKPGGVWRCVKYVEMNPVRAGLASEPGDYPYSTWGRYCRSERHPFGRYFVRHMKQCLGDPVVARWTAQQLYDEFRRQLANEMAEDAELYAHNKRMDEEAGTTPPDQSDSQSKLVEYRGRYWIHGGIIGSAQYVAEVLAHLASQRQPASATEELPAGADPPATPRQFHPLRVGDQATDDSELLSYHRPYGRQGRPRAPA